MIERLYHYSKDKYDAIKTREAQGYKEEHYKGYNTTMSFFFEHVPLDILGTVYKGTKNDFWIAGNRIYEYEILIKDMPEFSFEIVETSEITKMYYDFFYDSKGNDLNRTDTEVEKFKDNKYKRMEQLGYIRDNKEEFIKIAGKFIGTTRKAYLEISNKPNFKDRCEDSITGKYAATVPHVMLRPKGGIVNYHSVKQVVIGNRPIHNVATEHRGYFGHLGRKYDLEVLIKAAKAKPVQQIAVNKLTWVLEHATPDSDRLKKAHTSLPIWVWYDQGKWNVVDGLHRLVKAIANHQATMPCIVFNNIEMQRALVTTKVSRESILETW